MYSNIMHLIAAEETGGKNTKKTHTEPHIL